MPAAAILPIIKKHLKAVCAPGRAAGLRRIIAVYLIFRAPPLSRKVFRAAMTCSTWEATVVQQPPTASAPAFM